MRPVIVAALCLLLSSCTPYALHPGRKGPLEPPQVFSGREPDAITMAYDPSDDVPALVTPIIKQVWIMPHRTAAGDYAGAYLLNVVIRPGDIAADPGGTVTIPTAPATIPVPDAESNPAPERSVPPAAAPTLPRPLDSHKTTPRPYPILPQPLDPREGLKPGRPGTATTVPRATTQSRPQPVESDVIPRQPAPPFEQAVEESVNAIRRLMQQGRTP